MTRHQYGILALISQTSFGRDTSGRVTKCWLFSQATNISACKLKPHPLKKTSIFVTFSWIIPWFLKWSREVWKLKAIDQYGCFNCLWYCWCLWYWSLNFKLSPGFLPSDWCQKNISFLAPIRSQSGSNHLELAIVPRGSSRHSLLFFVPYFSAGLDFPSPPLSAPGSPRMGSYLFWPRIKALFN